MDNTNTSAGSHIHIQDYNEKYGVHGHTNDDDDNNNNGVTNTNANTWETPQVIIANYTPKIDPLPPLALEPHNEFSELLLCNPYAGREGEGLEEAVHNDKV